MEAQRRTKKQLDQRPGAARADNSAIGGAVQRAIVTRDGVSSEIVHRWPDVIRSKINAAA